MMNHDPRILPVPSSSLSSGVGTSTSTSTFPSADHHDDHVGVGVGMLDMNECRDVNEYHKSSNRSNSVIAVPVHHVDADADTVSESESDHTHTHTHNYYEARTSTSTSRRGSVSEVNGLNGLNDKYCHAHDIRNNVSGYDSACHDNNDNNDKNVDIDVDVDIVPSHAHAHVEMAEITSYAYSPCLYSARPTRL